MYLVGKIINTHGLKGHLKANINKNLLDIFTFNNKFYINYLSVFLLSCQKYKNFFLVKFQGLDTLSQVEKFKSFDIYSDQHIFFKKNNFYRYKELINNFVYNEDKILLGQVTFIREVPQGYILEITKKNGIIFLVPFISFFVKKIYCNNIIMTKSIEGLI